MVHARNDPKFRVLIAPLEVAGVFDRHLPVGRSLHDEDGNRDLGNLFRRVVAKQEIRYGWTLGRKRVWSSGGTESVVRPASSSPRIRSARPASLGAPRSCSRMIGGA